jgi:hypothetical protein
MPVRIKGRRPLAIHWHSQCHPTRKSRFDAALIRDAGSPWLPAAPSSALRPPPCSLHSLHPNAVANPVRRETATRRNQTRNHAQNTPQGFDNAAQGRSRRERTLGKRTHNLAEYPEQVTSDSMSYVCDEIPILPDPPAEHQHPPVCALIPSLANSLFRRQPNGAIYGSQAAPVWCVSTAAFRGKGCYDFWLKHLPPSLPLRLMLLALLRWTSIRKAETGDWIGKALLVTGLNDREIHFFVYSPGLDVSLDLHVQEPGGRHEAFSRGLEYLAEIEVSETST